MRRLKFLLRPGWLALVVVVLLFSGACFWLLSPWQFGRNAGNERQNQAIEASEHIAPVPLAGFLPADSEPRPAQLWRKVTITGHYLPALETVARLRTVSGQPAYEVLTPLRSTDGTLVLIDRGWVNVDNGHLPSYPPPPSGTVHVTARTQADEQPDAQHRPPQREAGHTELYQINGRKIGQLQGVHFRSGYFQLVAGQPGVLKPIPLPDITSGPYLSYALQWIAFGVMALFGLGYFTARELKPGGALTAESRARRRENRTDGRSGQPDRQLRGRRAVAAAIAEEAAAEEEQEPHPAR